MKEKSLIGVNLRSSAPSLTKFFLHTTSLWGIISLLEVKTDDRL
jgi:hypothetical protein